jgi:hypothetical protein
VKINRPGICDTTNQGLPPTKPLNLKGCSNVEELQACPGAQNNLVPEAKRKACADNLLLASFTPRCGKEKASIPYDIERAHK